MSEHKRSYSISARLQQSETENYLMMEKRYRSGKVTYLDLTNAIADLSSARSQHINDRYALEKDRHQYQYYKGTLYDSFSK